MPNSVQVACDPHTRGLEQRKNSSGAPCPPLLRRYLSSWRLGRIILNSCTSLHVRSWQRGLCYLGKHQLHGGFAANHVIFLPQLAESSLPTSQMATLGLPGQTLRLPGQTLRLRAQKCSRIGALPPRTKSHGNGKKVMALGGRTRHPLKTSLGPKVIAKSLQVPGIRILAGASSENLPSDNSF